MKCKICDTENENIKYDLRNSKVYKCKKCNFHYSNYLDEEYGSEIENNEPLDDSLREYLRHQLQNNESKFANQVKISCEYLININSPKILDIGIGGGLFLSLISNSGIKPNYFGIELDEKG
tara:strand:+ start:72 stop:434 length:363 start_codon:yes stop_codon:yes gene_type:complete